MFKLYILAFAFKTITCSCTQEFKSDFEPTKHKIKKVGEMPVQVDESSGLAVAGENELWTHNDSGGEPKLYKVNLNGELLDSVTVPGAKNIDWEEITRDKSGNIYIGDMGNNAQRRQDLTIYKYNSVKTEKIEISYADQTAFPPLLPEYDCEAFFWHKDSLYLFSKSHTKKKFVTRLYVSPATAGKYTLKPMDSFIINSPVTAADISPDGTEFALLTYGKILIFGITDGKINFSHPKTCFKTRRKQTESLTYTDNKVLIFGNEQGKIYRLMY